jgi:hypothetical protein
MLTENAAATTHRLQLRELEMQYVVPKNTHFRKKFPIGDEGRKTRARFSRQSGVYTRSHTLPQSSAGGRSDVLFCFVTPYGSAADRTRSFFALPILTGESKSR